MSDTPSKYEDDKTILDEAELWRRIPSWHIVPDENIGRKRPSSAAFEDHPDGSPMSVILGQEVLASGREASSVIEDLGDFSLASITAKLARSLEQGIVRRPRLPRDFGRRSDDIAQSTRTPLSPGHRRAFALAGRMLALRRSVPTGKDIRP